jgi:Protein of unknown function (DUF4232)
MVAGVTIGSVLTAVALGSTGLSPSSRCLLPQLRLAATFYGEAGGQFVQTFTFTNVSRQACRMEGWPRIGIEVAPSQRVAVRTRRVVQGQSGGRPFARVLLRSQGAASFDVYGEDWDHLRDRSCPKTTAALVTPPGGPAALRVSVRDPSCPSGLEIAPLTAGRIDRQAWSVVWNG